METAGVEPTVSKKAIIPVFQGFIDIIKIIDYVFDYD